jgi:hypothetical protein
MLYSVWGKQQTDDKEILVAKGLVARTDAVAVVIAALYNGGRALRITEYRDA